MAATRIPLTLASESARSCCCGPVDALTQGRSRPARASETAEFGLLGLICGGSASRVAAALRSLDGVLDVKVAAFPPPPSGASALWTVQGSPTP